MIETIRALFIELNGLIEESNVERRQTGVPLILRSRIEILGQTSLLVQPDLAYVLNLAQTGDLDAKLRGDFFIKEQLKKLLPKYGFIYDEDSPLIYIPEGSTFLPFLDLTLIEIVVIDPESALVSKAVKAPEKNRQLIRQAIASEKFPRLIARIEKAGGDLNHFI